MTPPPPGFTQYAELERRANEIWMFEPLIIPGPFQAEGYARAIMASLLSPAVMDLSVRYDLMRGHALSVPESRKVIRKAVDEL